MMPARWPGLKCCLLTLIGVVFLIPPTAETQTNRGSVALTGSVSETVALSIASGSPYMDVISSPNTVRITLSGADAGPIRVPLIVRSNTSFKISAQVDSKTTQLAQLSVTDVRASGRMVSPLAVTDVNIPQQFDLRRSGDNASVLDFSSLDQPFVVASGPRISLGGTLDSPHNALQITLVIGLKSQPVPGSPVHLTFVATAGSPVQ
jgi:hypothetical protein